MTARSLLLLCSLFALSGCASRGTQLGWGTTADGAPFVEVVDVVRRGDVALPSARLTLVAGPGVCDLRVLDEPDAWLITWRAATGPDREPRYLRADRVDTDRWPGQLWLRTLVAGTPTGELQPLRGSEGWAWQGEGSLVAAEPLALQLDADGRHRFDQGDLAVAVRRAQVGLDRSR